MRTWGTPVELRDCHRLQGETCGIPHLAKNERDDPNFLYAALDRTPCAPFFKERRRKFREPTKLHRKSGVWGTRLCDGDRHQKRVHLGRCYVCDSDAAKMRRRRTRFERSYPLANILTEQNNGDGSEGVRITLKP